MAIPCPSGYPLPGYDCGAGAGAGAGTFAEFLERRRQYVGYIDQHVPYGVLLPVPCGHCGMLEDLRRDWDTYNDSDGSEPPDLVLDGSLADQIAFEGSSCFTCAKKIFLATTDWIDGGEHRHDTPLHYAARSGNLRLLFHLLCLLGDRFGNEAQYAALVLRKLNVHGETALHEAIRLGRSSTFMVKMLMWVDQHLALHPIAGTSPLYLAVSLGHKHIAQMLHSTSGGNLSYSGPHGQNALHSAIHRPYGMIEMLLDWNEDLSKGTDKNGSTPLHSMVSAQSERYIGIRCLRFPYMWFPLKKQATWRVLNANLSAAYRQDDNGLFPVHIAALMDRMVAMLILLEICPGCMALRDKQGRSFLHIAVQNRVHRIVKYACQEPFLAPILNARDNDGNTALHLAVEVDDLFIFCSLLSNANVLLNVRNTKDQTPLDLARSKIGGKFSYALNPDEIIYRTLSDAGARHGSFWGDRVQQLCIQKKDEENQSQEVHEEDPVKELVKMFKKKLDKEEKEANRKKKEDDEKKDSDQMNDSTRTLGVGSVLITTMTFGATFTVPAAVKAVNNSNGGIPGLLDTWYFKGFMLVNATAFVYSSIATLSLMFSGMSMVKLQIRRVYFNIAVFFASSSLSCLTVAFGLGVHIVLAPVDRALSTGIFILSSLVPLYQTIDFVRGLRFTYQPLSVRRGHKFVCQLFIWRLFLGILPRFWPFLILIGAASKRPGR